MRSILLITLVAMLSACDAGDSAESNADGPSASGTNAAQTPEGGTAPVERVDETAGVDPILAGAGEGSAGASGVLAPGAGDDAGAGSVELPGLVIALPTGWATRAPASSMRAAEIVLPRSEGEDEASLVVFHFGPGGAGTAEANLARWRSQFAMPDGSDPSDHARIESMDLGGRAMVVMRLDGTYIAETTPGSGERVNKENWSLVGAVVETSAGPYYLKLVGPASVIERERASIDAMLAGIAPK